MFIWNSLHDALPVGEQFSHRNIPLPNCCPRCNESESVLHKLFTFNFSKEVWNLAPLASTFNPSLTLSVGAGLETLRRVPSLPPIRLGPGTLSAWICLNLWIARNQLIFQKRYFTPEETLVKAIHEARAWSSYQESNLKSQSPLSRINPDSTLDPYRICMYTDAAWNPLTKCAGLTWIIDDA